MKTEINTDTVGLKPELRGDIKKLTGDIRGVRGRVSSSLHGDVSSITGDVTGLYGDISGLVGDVSNIFGELNNIGYNFDVTQISGNITDIQSTQYRDAIPQLIGDVSNLQGYTHSIYGTIDPQLHGSLSDWRTIVNGDITDLTGDISNLCSTVSHLKGDVSNISGQALYTNDQVFFYIGGNVTGKTINFDEFTLDFNKCDPEKVWYPIEDLIPK